MLKKIFDLNSFFTILSIILISSSLVHAKESEPTLIPDEVVLQVIDYFIFGELINQELVEDYVPFEFSESAPLLISNNLLSNNINLSKFGKSVQILPASQLQNNAFIYFESFTVKKPETATAIFKYVNGGLIGNFSFELDKRGQWELKDVKVSKD
ncbi:MAG: hypothetical protein P9M03_11790 [Candidatus Theseobacter exili]|nr:hypothetical protein [Candidatus Theseobacter exili]